MISTPSRQKPSDARERRRGGKYIAAIGAFLLIGATLIASQAFRPNDVKVAVPAVGVVQEDKAPEHTAKAVEAAAKFLKGLDDALRAKASFEFDSDKRPRWSNLPITFVPRNGVRMGELTKEQRSQAMAVVAAVTSKEGYQKVLDIIAGDDVLAKGGGGKGGKGKKGGKDLGFGFDNFYLAVFGKPSAKEPWLVQFGGHHLALNVTIVGKEFVLTPTLTCAQPSAFVIDGKKVRPLGVESDTAFRLMGKLNEKQREKAILMTRVSDLLLGPGRDGKEIAPDGLKGADMDEKQRELLVDLAAAWVNILHESSATKRMEEIKAGIKDTYFAWSGPTADGSAAYFRVQGPTVVIEYAPQGNTDHIHTIVRELGNDYGKKLTKR